MPSSRRSSNFDINEIHNNKNNRGLISQPFNIDHYHNINSNNNNLNCVVSTSGALESASAPNADLNATTTSVASPAIPPMVSIEKTTLQDKNAIPTTTIATPAATTITTTTATPKHAPSYIEQRRQSQAANIKLIGLVRRRPWLYDSSHSYYAKKHLIEKTWAQIGKIVGETGALCKERWRNIRAAFARSINIYKTQSGPNRLKPYYLHRELQFLINPMTKGRKGQKKSEDSSTEESSINGEGEGGEGANDIDLISEKDEMESDERVDNIGKSVSKTVEGSNEIVVNNVTNHNDNNNASQQQATTHNSKTTVANGNGYDSNDVDDDAMMDVLTNYSFSDIDTSVHNRMLDCDDLPRQLTRLKKDRFEDIPDDADLLFVKSLYYDMSNLDVAQKLRLKKNIYETLEQVTSTTQTQQQTTSATYNLTTPPRPLPLPQAPQPIQPMQSSLTASQKLSLNLIRNLDETKLQTLNQFIRHILAPHTLTNNNNNNNQNQQQSGRLVQNISNLTNLHENPIMQRVPNTTRLLGTTDNPNGGLTYSFNVKEETLDDLANMLYPPSY